MLILEDEDNIKVEDLKHSVSSLQFKMDKMKQQFGLVDDTEKATPINFFTVENMKTFKMEEFIDNIKAIVKEKAENNESFEIIDLSLNDVFQLSKYIAELLVEDHGKKSRVYGRVPLSSLDPDVLLSELCKELLTNDPDYEIIRYTDRIEVRYMRNSEEN